MRLQSMVTEMKRGMHVKTAKNLCRSSITELDIPPVSQVNSSVQVSLPVNKPEMKDAQVSLQRSTASNSRNVSINVIQRWSHRRTYSDGEVFVASNAQHGHITPNFVNSHNAGQQSDSRTHPSSRKTSVKIHSCTPEIDSTSYKSSQKHSCSYQQCAWQHKAKSLQQRLRAVSEQVMMHDMTDVQL